MDIAVNKPAKDFLKREFEQYSEEVTKQFQGVDDIDSVELQPVNLCMAAVKELSARWLVDMAEYIANNPQFGFLRAGILNALDGSVTDDEDSDDADTDGYSDTSMSDSECEDDD